MFLRRLKESQLFNKETPLLDRVVILIPLVLKVSAIC